MATSSAIFILIFICSYSSSKHIKGDEKQKLVWPPEYHLKTERLILGNDMKESNEIWYSTKQQKSRLDFYGGTSKHYYIWPQEDKDGYSFMVFPMSTETFLNEYVCMKEASDTTQLLPNASDYKYAGDKNHEGKLVQVWILKNNTKKGVKRQFTIYTYKSGSYDVPVQMVNKAWYTERGALAGSSITNYFSFEPQVDESALDYTSDDCDPNDPIRRNDDVYNLEYLHPALDPHVDVAFKSFKKLHTKNYASKNEEEMRKLIFQKNWQTIVNHNRQNLGYKMAVNRFADYTPEEMARLRSLRPSRQLRGTRRFPHSDDEVLRIMSSLPETYDMRVEGWITPIKNQAGCGSCWAFSSTAAVEGVLTRNNGGRLLDLSEQSMVDCAWGFSNAGCNGGDMESAFKYILKHGLPMEEDYGPYLEEDGMCHRDNATELFRIRGFALVTPHNPHALRVALYSYGPVAVTINFSDAMALYSTGIFYDPECNKGHFNHGVTVVGYGTQNGTDYWIVKNSHGVDWGEEGYIRIDAKDNNCFLLGTPYYPID